MNPLKKCFYVQVENRNENTMEKILFKYVLPGSVVYTDQCKAYDNQCLEALIVHRIVNHSFSFKDPLTNVHTNTIEGLNNGLKTLWYQKPY